MAATNTISIGWSAKKNEEGEPSKLIITQNSDEVKLTRAQALILADVILVKYNYHRIRTSSRG